jgi:hypothetical protein
MVDLGPFQEVMKENIFKIILLGCVIIVGNYLFRRLEKKLKSKRRRR